MMTRQTFYLSRELGEELRLIAFENRSKISQLVNEAIRQFIDRWRKKSRAKPVLLNYIGKFPELKSIHPLKFQKKLRSEWHKK